MIYVCKSCLKSDIKKTLRNDSVKRSGMYFYKKSSNSSKLLYKICAQCNDGFHKDSDEIKEYKNFEEYEKELKYPLIIKKLKNE
tara:strand:- start:371 stop:622 length:252 start_codon:yes stop_codon:yes gene_type:complete